MRETREHAFRKGNRQYGRQSIMCSTAGRTGVPTLKRVIRKLKRSFPVCVLRLSLSLSLPRPLLLSLARSLCRFLRRSLCLSLLSPPSTVLSLICDPRTQFNYSNDIGP